jgi:TatD DNase family protein
MVRGVLLLVDSHAHIDSERYAEDREAMLRRAWEAGVGTIMAIGIGDRAVGMGRALEVCRQFNARPESGRELPRLYASAGVYPHDTVAMTAATLTELDRLLAEPEVLACGEIGLDYYNEGAPNELQREKLIVQLEIAASHKLPILIHCRPKNGATNAWEDLFEILQAHWRPTGLGGIMHCFSGGWEQVRQSLDWGFLLSFAGNLTYPNAQPMRDVAAKLPLDGILVETDAPYLTPVPHRGQRNESALMVHTAQVLAESMGASAEEIASATTKNFLRLFHLGSNVGNC